MKYTRIMLSTILLTAVMALVGCDDAVSAQGQPQAASGVTQATAKVTTGSDGLTVEQRNIKSRLEEDNKPGVVKHLYIISPYSGQVILYSTVKGKVTSGGKRLTPTHIAVGTSGDNKLPGVEVKNIPTASGFWNNAATDEVLQDDGTYGQSGDYLYWWDVRGVYHQHYLTGGQIVHISSVPISVKSVTLNLEAPAEK